MAKLNECVISSLESQGYTTGKINERLYAWLSDQTGRLRGSLNEQWVTLLTGMGYSGTLNEMQMQSWFDLGAPLGSWNEMAIWFWCINGGQYGPTGPAFWALTPDPDTYEMLGVREGVGDLTTVHTADLYAPDFEGVYREFGTDEPVWSGGRVVRNLCKYSEDFSNEAWTKASTTITTGITDPLGGTTAVTVTSGGVGSYIGQHMGALHKINEVAANSLWIRRRTGTGTISMYSGYGTTAIDVTSAITSSWQRIATPAIESVAEVNDYIGVKFGTSGDEVDIAFAQFEQVTSQSNQNPGEYVPTTTAPATKVFANQNGNTVLNNVVTEAIGAPLPETPYLQYYPAATNSIDYSRDLSNAAWSVAGSIAKTYDQIGLTGEPNTASLLSDTIAVAAAYTRNSIAVPDDSNTHTLKLWVHKDQDQTRFPEVTFFLLGGTGQTVYCQFNTETGDHVIRGTAGTPTYDAEIIEDGDWFIVMISLANNGTGNVTLYVDLYPAISTSWGLQEVAAQGSIIVGNVELHLNKTVAEVRGLGPIFTTTAAVATDATVYSFDIANHDDTASWYLEYTTELDPDGSAVSHGLIQTKNDAWGQLGYHNKNAGNGTVTSRDEGSITSSLSFSYSVGELLKYGLVSSIADGNKTVRGGLTDWSADGAFIGFSKTSIALGRFIANLSAYGIQFRELQRYDITSYANGKQIIDDLMGA